MKKYLIALLCMLVVPSANADDSVKVSGRYSGAFWYIYPNEGCAIGVKGLDDYYFCGAHEPKCNNDWAENSEIEKTVHYLENGEVAVLKGEKYWCCGGKVTKKPTKKKDTVTGVKGSWVKGDSFYISRETKTKNISGGTCTYVETTDICGNVTSTEQECKTQAAANVQCPDGQYFRTSSNSCAKLCDVGYAYESATSNRCVECEETAYQGIVSDTGVYINGEAVDPTHAVCRRCNTAASIFDAATRTCIGKPQLTTLSINDLQYGKNAHSRTKPLKDQCWTKYGDEYKECVLGK